MHDTFDASPERASPTNTTASCSKVGRSQRQSLSPFPPHVFQITQETSGVTVHMQGPGFLWVSVTTSLRVNTMCARCGNNYHGLRLYFVYQSLLRSRRQKLIS